MNVFDLEYNLNNKAVEIYVAGCTRGCKGCHNPETWPFNAGKPMDKECLQEMHKTIDCDLVENVWILGGEPLQQEVHSLLTLLKSIRYSHPEKKIWLFTSYELSEVPPELLIHCDYIKTGRFLCDLPNEDGELQHGIHLASSNQHVYKKDKDGFWGD